MRINLTKKDLINQIYMQLGFSKLVSENLINDFFATIILNLKEKKNLNYQVLELFPLGGSNLELAEILKQRNLKLFQVEMWFYLNLRRNLKNL